MRAVLIKNEDLGDIKINPIPIYDAQISLMREGVGRCYIGLLLPGGKSYEVITETDNSTRLISLVGKLEKMLKKGISINISKTPGFCEVSGLEE